MVVVLWVLFVFGTLFGCSQLRLGCDTSARYMSAPLCRRCGINCCWWVRVGGLELAVWELGWWSFFTLRFFPKPFLLLRMRVFSAICKENVLVEINSEKVYVLGWVHLSSVRKFVQSLPQWFCFFSGWYISKVDTLKAADICSKRNAISTKSHSRTSHKSTTETHRNGTVVAQSPIRLNFLHRRSACCCSLFCVAVGFFLLLC